MAHQLTIRENGIAEFAFLGERHNIWHGLGQEMQEGASLEDWRVAAGMDWEAKDSVVTYDNGQDQASFQSHKVLFRSDTLQPMSVVGSGFQVVQPADVLGFFDDLLRLHDLKMSTAGTLFGGKRFFALAETGNEFKLNGHDEVFGNLLLVTSIDGTMATQAYFTSTRVVCMNTLQLSQNGTKQSLIKVSHKSAWNPKQVKIDMGLLDSGWAEFKTNCEKLSNIKMNEEQAYEFFRQTILGNKGEDDASTTAKNRVEELAGLYTNGAGAMEAYGTAWGVLNAITNAGTHGFQQGRKSSPSSQLWKSMIDDKMKQQAYTSLLELA